jgi:hypothetical protein
VISPWIIFERASIGKGRTALAARAINLSGRIRMISSATASLVQLRERQSRRVAKIRFIGWGK